MTVVDAVGAGDAFLAMVIHGLIKRQPMPETLASACMRGAWVASQAGAVPR